MSLVGVSKYLLQHYRRSHLSRWRSFSSLSVNFFVLFPFLFRIGFCVTEKPFPYLPFPIAYLWGELLSLTAFKTLLSVVLKQMANSFLTFPGLSFLFPSLHRIGFYVIEKSFPYVCTFLFSVHFVSLVRSKAIYFSLFHPVRVIPATLHFVSNIKNCSDKNLLPITWKNKIFCLYRFKCFTRCQ